MRALWLQRADGGALVTVGPPTAERKALFPGPRVRGHRCLWVWMPSESPWSLVLCGPPRGSWSNREAFCDRPWMRVVTPRPRVFIRGTPIVAREADGAGVPLSRRKERVVTRSLARVAKPAIPRSAGWGGACPGRGGEAERVLRRCPSVAGALPSRRTSEVEPEVGFTIGPRKGNPLVPPGLLRPGPSERRAAVLARTAKG